MKIGHAEYKPPIRRSPILLALISFFIYNLVLVCLGVVLFHSFLSPSSRQQIIDKVLILLNKKSEKTSQFFEDRDSMNIIFIDLAESDLKKLHGMTDSILKENCINTEIIHAIPANLRYRDQCVSADIRCHTAMVPLRRNHQTALLEVTVVSDEDLFDLRHFYLYPPNPDDIAKRWLVNNLFSYAGHDSKYIDIVKVQVSGAEVQYLAVEEIPEIPVFEIDHGAILKNSVQKSVDSDQVVDEAELASYLALVDLLGGKHPGNLITQLYFPGENSWHHQILKRDIYPSSLESRGLLGAEKQLDINNYQFEGNKSRTVHGSLPVFSDTAFYRGYIRALEQLSKNAFVSEFLSTNNEKMVLLLKKLGYPEDLNKFPGLSIIKRNQAYIRNALQPAKLVQPNIYEIKKSDHQIIFEIANIHNLPVEISSLWYADSILIGSITPHYIMQANSRFNPVDKQIITFSLNDQWVDSMVINLSVTANVLGSNYQKRAPVLNFPVASRNLRREDIFRRKTNMNEFSFLEIDKHKIKIKEGNHVLNEPLIIPKGYLLTAAAGTTLDLQNRALILSYSPLLFLGEPENPVKVISTDSSGQGLVVLQTNEESTLSHVHFHALSNPSQAGWSLTSAITFYESPVIINYCLFERNQIGDDYLNIVRTEFSMDHSQFINCYADAFDGDFCTGKITNTDFRYSGNDAIDISGSDLVVDNIRIDEVGDKGISVGEKSTLSGDQVFISNAEIAVTSKDLSNIIIDEIEISNSRIAYTAFQKKSEFGPGTIDVRKRSQIIGKTEINYLIETESELKILGKKITTSLQTSHVRDLLYGVKFGKSSS